MALNGTKVAGKGKTTTKGKVAGKGTITGSGKAPQSNKKLQAGGLDKLNMANKPVKKK